MKQDNRTMTEILRDRRKAAKEAEERAWYRRHRKVMLALRSPQQVLQDALTKQEREERRAAAVRARVTSATAERLAENFTLAPGTVQGVLLKADAHPSAHLYPVQCRRGVKYKVALHGRSLWSGQVAALIKNHLKNK